MRKQIIIGNWKLNKTPYETIALIEQIKPLVQDSARETVVCPSTVTLFAAKAALDGSKIGLGAQNAFFEDSGAYTGETSCDALCEVGVRYVILGHSERRQYFAETDETVNKKVLKVLEKRMIPVLCVGETLEQKKLGITAEIVRQQTKVALCGVNAGCIGDVIIAYEPVWAIGTGMTATSADANDTIKEIRGAVRELYGDLAEQVRILYGGSMNDSNAFELLAMSDIDGGLIGGASLKADAFARIVNC